MIYPSINQRR